MRYAKTLCCDFETTVYENQEKTEVWSVACVELYTEDVLVFHSLPEFYEYIVSLNKNLLLYFHNLKFDGSFILSFLLKDLKMKQAFDMTNNNPIEGSFKNERDMENNTFKYTISNMGQWYTIVIKVNNKFIEIRDSLKLLPFSLERIGESFKTKHKKLTMEYKGRRYAGCEITPEEMEYIKNDVLVMKEALEIMYSEGHKKLTIGSCCLEEFKKTHIKEDYEMFFPNLYDYRIDEKIYGVRTAGEYIKKSYKGGWCYLVKGKEHKKYYNGVTVDVNSLYPSMMSSESGNYYPVSEPHFWVGDIPKEAYDSEYNGNISHKYYFVRIKTRFKIKENYLPFVQIKNNFLYRGNECLESSDVTLCNGEVVTEYENPDGTHNDGRVILTLTMTDYILLKEHYDLIDCEVLDGCWFYAEKGIFDDYIEKYKKIKLESKGAIRELAKLFLNNLYGKMATSPDSSFKYAMMKDNVLSLTTVRASDKTPGYITIGSAITSYARNFTIRASQKNFYGKDKAGFIYADTDSIHCDLPMEEIKGVELHDKNFCCWKVECEWDIGFYSRQKTYIEHIVIKDDKKLEIPYYDIKCAGMPPRSKYLFNLSISGNTPVESKYELSEEEEKFVKEKHTIEDFKIGLKVPGKLLAKRIEGGTVLSETTFEFR